MPGILHEKMVNASKHATAIVLNDGADLMKLSNRPRRVPDLFHSNEIAIEALTFPNGGRLEKFGYTYKSLVVVIPVPDNVTDIWLYDEVTGKIVEKFHRNVDKIRVPRIQLKCFRCDYEWTPRISGQPKMCPQCKSRDWNVRQSHSFTEQERKKERIRRLTETTA